MTHPEWARTAIARGWNAIVERIPQAVTGQGWRIAYRISAGAALMFAVFALIYATEWLTLQLVSSAEMLWHSVILTAAISPLIYFTILKRALTATDETLRLQDELRDRQRRLDALIMSIPGIVYRRELGPNGRITYVSKGVIALLGYRPEDFTESRMKFQRLIHPDDLWQSLSEIDSAIDAGRLFSIEYRARSASGEYRWLWDRGCAVSTEGEVAAVEGCAIDITERKQAESTLMDSKDFWHRLLDELPVPIWHADITGDCDYFNKAWLAFTGRALYDEVGTGWLASIHPDDRRDYIRASTRAIGAGEPFSIEYRIRRHDGVYRWVIDRGSAHANADSRVAGFIGTTIDITERKERMERLGYEATHDALTGAANRRMLEDHLELVVARATRSPSVILMMDLDRFKAVNDSVGHHAGDQALIMVTKLIRQHLRAGDLLARLGGDEFVAVLEETSLNDASIIAERLRAAVSEHSFVVEGRNFHLGLSIGMTVIDGAMNYANVIACADKAMYRAKSLGRDRVVDFADMT